MDSVNQLFSHQPPLQLHTMLLSSTRLMPSGTWNTSCSCTTMLGVYWNCMRAILKSQMQLSWICSRLSSFVSPIRLSAICRSMDVPVKAATALCTKVSTRKASKRFCRESLILLGAAGNAFLAKLLLLWRKWLKHCTIILNFIMVHPKSIYHGHSVPQWRPFPSGASSHTKSRGTSIPVAYRVEETCVNFTRYR